MKRRNYILIIFLILFLGIGTFFLISNKELNDAEKFSKEYTQVSNENVFVYKNSKEIINILKKGTGVVYLGFPECKWCQAYVPILNEAAKENGITKIYYYNIYEDRKNNTNEYQELVSILKDHLQFDNEGNPRIYVPNVSFVIKGEIIGNDYETSLDTANLAEPEQYWTIENKTKLKNTLANYMKKVYESIDSCTECNE